MWYEESDREIESDDNEYLTPKEVMYLLGIGKNKFYKLANSGQIPAVRLGHEWRVNKFALRKAFGGQNEIY